MRIKFLSIVFIFFFSLTCKANLQYTKVDFSHLIEESIEKNSASTEGLTLIVQQNSCSRQAENEIEMNRCMREGIWNPDRSGFEENASILTFTQPQNPFGLENNITMLYSGFFYVTHDNVGKWNFQLNSQGATDLFIDGRNILNWYGEHAVNETIRKAEVYLEEGWHHIKYRYMNLSDEVALDLLYDIQGGTQHKFSTDTLLLKSYAFSSGLTLITHKEKRLYSPTDHETLDNLVNLEFDDNVSYSGIGTVLDINQTYNRFGIDNNYTSSHEGWFYVRDGRAGSWGFRLESDDFSDVMIDNTLLLSHYEGDAHLQDNISLDVGWHQIKVLALNETESSKVILHVSPPSESEQLFSANNVPMKSYGADVDFDGLHQDIETIMGTDGLNYDSDADMLNDYAELFLGTNPHESDTNHDGRSDYLELIDAKYNPETKTFDNLWNRDNDKDGVPDGLDISPSTKTDFRDSFHFEVDTQGKATYLDFQIRPENKRSLKWLGKTLDWPFDRTGQMQDRDQTRKDVRLIPMLELTSDILPTQESVKDAGIMITDDTKLPSYKGDYTHNDGFGAGNVLGDSKSEVVIAGDHDHKIVIQDDKGKTLKSFDSVFSTGDVLSVGDVLGDSRDEIVVLHKVITRDVQTSNYVTIKEYIYIYNGNGGRYLKTEVNTGTSDNQIAIGHYVTNHLKADIVIATGSRVLVFNISGERSNYTLNQYASKDINTIDDGFTLGDVDGDGIDEIWIAHNVDDRLEMFRDSGADHFSLWKSIDLDYDLSDGLLADDILPSEDASSSEYGEEIIVLKKAGGIKVYTESSHKSSADNDTYDYSAFDGFASSDLTGDGVDEIVISADTSGVVSMHAPQKQKAYIPLMPIQEYGYTIGFQGRMLYSTSNKSSMKLISDVKLVWMVVGQTDTKDDEHANKTTVLAHYAERFSLTGFSAEEQLGSSAAVLYNATDSDVVSNSYNVLLQEFVHNNRTLSGALDYLHSNGMVFDDNLSTTLDGTREAAKYLEDQLHELVVGANKLSEGKHPIILATQNKTTSIGLNEIVGEDNTQAYSGNFVINLATAEPIITNTLKQNWYNTEGTPVVSPMSMDEISDYIDSGNESDLEKDNAKLFAFVASLGSYCLAGENVLSTPSRSSALSWVKQGKKLAQNVLWASYDGIKTYLKISKQFKNFWTHYEGAKSMKQLFQANKESGFASRMVQKLSFGKIKPTMATKIIKYGGAAVTVATSVYIFYAIASASGWSASGIALGAVAGSAYLVYGAALTFIAAFVPVGTVIAALIIFSDLIAWAITGEAWSDRAVEWLMDTVSKTTMPSPWFNISAMKVSIADYDDNGLTVGDRIDVRFRATQTMRRGEKVTGYSYDKLVDDLKNSYYKPSSYFPETYGIGNYHCIDIRTKETVSKNKSTCKHDLVTRWVEETKPYNYRTGSQRYLVNKKYENLDGRLYKIRRIWDYGAWVEPTSASKDFKATLKTKMSLHLDYGECSAGICDTKTKNDSTTLSKELVFDVLPATLNDFVNWSILKPLDSDDDGLEDVYENQSAVWFSFYGENNANQLGHLNIVTSDKRFNILNDWEDYPINWKKVIRFVPSPQEGYVNIMNADGELMRNSSGDTINDPGGQWKLEKSIDGKVFIMSHAFNNLGLVIPNQHNSSVILNSKTNYADKMLWRIEPLGGATDASRFDSDGDGLSDYYEMNLHVEGVFIDPLSSDTDGDGLSDKEELIYGSNPTKADSDGDGLDDKLEHDGFAGIFTYNGEKFNTRYYPDPQKIDSDFDSVSDRDESERAKASNPFSQDTDGDGLKDKDDLDPMNIPSDDDSDGDKVNAQIESDGFSLTVVTSLGTTNRHFDSSAADWDTDGDGLSDYQEYQASDPHSDDSDSDGLNDFNETQHHTNPINFDSDSDGLSDGDEVLTYHSNPLKSDTDLDGLNDGEEVHTYSTNPTLSDSDSDGLNDGDEIANGTNPLVSDSDSDGLNDSAELSVYLTDPTRADSDSDGLNDGEEVLTYLTNPTLIDTDADTLDDYYEVHYGDTHAGDINASSKDSDSDGLEDAFEINVSDSFPWSKDTDYDGLNDNEEVHYGTDIRAHDTDGDVLDDGYEVHTSHTNPLVKDSDGDGLYDNYEIDSYNTDPNNPDTDNDGIEDGWDRDTILQGRYSGAEVLLVLDDNVSKQEAFVDKLDTLVSNMGATLVTAYRNDVNISDYHFVLMLGMPDSNETNGTVNQMLSEFIPQDIQDKMRAEVDLISSGLDYNETTAEDANISSAYNRRASISDLVFNGLQRAGYNAAYLKDEVQNNGGNWTALTHPNSPLKQYNLENSIVLMITRLQVNDAYWALQEFSQLERLYFQNSALFRYPAHPQQSPEEQTSVSLDGVFKADTNMSIAYLKPYELFGTHYPTFIAAAISQYNEDNTPVDINISRDIQSPYIPLGKYIETDIVTAMKNASDFLILNDSITSAKLKFYYHDTELDRNANRIIGDIQDINESTLVLYRWDGNVSNIDDNDSSWSKITTNVTLHTDDITINDINYSGYLEANVSQLGFFTLAGKTYIDNSLAGRPEVISVSPNNNSIDLPVDTNISVLWSEPTIILDAQNIELSGADIIKVVMDDDNVTMHIVCDTLSTDLDYNLSIGIGSVEDFSLNENNISFSSFFSTVASNNAPFAMDDNLMSNSETPISFNVFSDNGSGTDYDSENDPLDIATIEANSSLIGTDIAGSMGGIFNLSSNGQMHFNPHGDFASIREGDSVTTSVSYSISDGTSESSAMVNVHVSGINHSPFMTADTRFLHSITQNSGDDDGFDLDGDDDAFNNFNNRGTSVKDMLSSAGAIGDADNDTLGIKVENATSNNGVWQYSRDRSSLWSDITTNLPLFLTNDDYLRFVPDLNHYGSDNGYLQIRAFDGALNNALSSNSARVTIMVNQQTNLTIDRDGDGLSDGDEMYIYGTNPNLIDSDGDWINDGDEINIYATNPNLSDSDSDGLSDYEELNTYHTNPNLADSDGDGVNDGDEVAKGTDPNVPDSKSNFLPAIYYLLLSSNSINYTPTADVA